MIGRMGDPIDVGQGVTIPHEELAFSFSRSGGPGGQHANRSETRVTLWFDIARSPSLDEAQRRRLLERLANRVDREGVLQLSADSERSQAQNRALALERFRALVAGALQRPKRRKRTRAPRGANERRLKRKRARGARKALRKKPERKDE